MITKGVPVLKKTKVQPRVLLPNQFRYRPRLIIERDNETKVLPISKAVAAELIAIGLNYEG